VNKWRIAVMVVASCGALVINFRTTEQVAFTTALPTPVVHFEAADYVAGATSWSNRIGGQADGVAPTGGMNITTSGVSAVQFTGKASSDSDRITGTVGSTSSVSKVTVEMWIRLKDSGSAQHIYGSMLFSWSGSPHYNIYHYKNGVGFNTISSELYGIDGTSFVDEWKHLTFVMVAGGSDSDQKIYVDGVLQNSTCNPSVTQLSASSCSYPAKRVFTSNGDFLFMDNGYSSNTWNAKADVGMLRVYDRELTSSEVLAVFDSTKNNGYLDTSGPSVTSATVPASPSSSRTLTYTLNFSEPTTGIAPSDFSNTGTATGCTFAPSSNSGTSVQVVVTCATDGTVVLNLDAHSVTDSITNTGPGSTWIASSVTLDSSSTTTTTSTVATTPSTTGDQTGPPANNGSGEVSTVESTMPADNESLSTVNTSMPPTRRPRSQNVMQSTTTTSPIRVTTTSTSSTTTTTTIPAVTPVSVPQYELGGVGMEIDGRTVDVDVTRQNDQIIIATPTVSSRLRVVRRDGSQAPLNEDGQLEARPGDSVRAEFDNLQPGSSLEIQMHSDPVLLGRTSIGDSGKTQASYEIPEDSPTGGHSFVAVGVDRDGQQFTFATSLGISEPRSGPGIVTYVIAIPLVGAVAMALFLPAALRSRRKLVK
jgi:hypothetical protein